MDRQNTGELTPREYMRLHRQGFQKALIRQRKRREHRKLVGTGKRRMIGREFELLSVIERDFGHTPEDPMDTRWVCACMCGNTIVVTQRELLNGKQSCGCADLPKQRVFCGISDTPEAQSYYNLLKRARRGELVCPEWIRSAAAFLADVGRRPSPLHSLMRLDKTKPFQPGNVAWLIRSRKESDEQQQYRIAA